MSGNIALLILALLLLQGMLAGAWAFGAIGLQLWSPPAQLWCAFAVAGALAMALLLARGPLPEALALGGAGVVLVLALLAMWRGLLGFVHQPPRDGEAAAVTVLLLLGLAGCALLLPQGPLLLSALQGLAHGAIVWTLARAGTTIWPALRSEFGARAGYLLLSPLVATLALLVLLLADGLIGLVGTAEPRAADSPFHLAALLLLLVLWLLVHCSLALMVLMRMLRRLRHLSQHDPLTGLINRREWQRRLEAQHRWLGRYGDGFALLLIDVDHFKRVNDTLGHAAGDAVLVNVAQVLIASARDVDTVGRIGGEEFAVLLPRADLAAARRAAERLRQMLCDSEIAWRGQPVRVTVSIGLALATDAEESPEQLSERADRALYQAKQNGRNRVVVARRAGG